MTAPWSPPIGRKAANRKVAPVAPTEDFSDVAFNSCPDYAALNVGVHQSSRTDTFRTPSRLDRGSSYDAQRSLQGVYSKGSSNNGAGLTKQILEDVQDLQETVVGLRKQMSETHDRDTAMADVLSQVHEKVHMMQKAAKNVATTENVNGRVDLAPLYEELRGSEARHAERLGALTERLDGRLEQEVAQVMEELREVRQQQKNLEEHQFVQVREDIQKSVSQMQRTFDRLAAEVHEIADAKNQPTRDPKEEHFENLTETITSCLVDQDSRRTKLNNDHFERMMVQLKGTQHASNSDTRTVLNELAKIQQALNVDFAQIVDELKEIHKESEHEDEFALEGEEKELLPEAVQVAKRFRHYGSNTDTKETGDATAQTDDTLLEGYAGRTRKRQHKKAQDAGAKQLQAETKAKKVFADGEQMKQKMREQFLKPPFNVVDYYHDSGCFQAVATNPFFENLTLLIILLNAIWIAVDTDLNEEEVLLNAHPVFIIAENAFCTYFSFELFVRFMAFRRKMFCFKDQWFIFDSILVFLMVVETWLINGFLLLLSPGGDGPSGTRNASMLRMIRMVRMLRISRMARLLRSIPELVVLIKGIKAASRSVMVFFLLWFVVIYVFAVLFKQLTQGEDVGKKFFETVPEAMNTLLLEGILPDSSAIVNGLKDEKPWMFPLIMLFIMLAGITIMYMLVGVLCDVVSVIAAAEKEGMTVAALANELRALMNSMDRDTEAPITQFEFKQLLQEENLIRILQSVNVDVTMILDMSDVIYEDDPEVQATGMTFEKFVDMLLSFRGTNQATVSDMADLYRAQKRLLSSEFENSARLFHTHFKAMSSQLAAISEDLSEGMEELDHEFHEFSARRQSTARMSTILAKGKSNASILKQQTASLMPVSELQTDE